MTADKILFLRKVLITSAIAGALALPAFTQTTNDSAAQNPAAPAQSSTSSSSDQASPQSTQSSTAVQPMDQTPVFRVQVVERTATAVDYRDRGGTTKVGMRGTNLMPGVTGDASVTGHTGRLAIDVNLHRMQPARTFGAQYLTYVLWAITPEGRPVNLGEVIPDNDGNSRVQVTSPLQAFGLIVTAEPYFAVTRPSDMIVAENYILKEGVQGFIRPIDAKFDLLKQGQYTTGINAEQLPATGEDPKRVPLQLLEARNAIAIARAEGAEQYASDTLAKAQDYLNRANDYFNRKQGTTPIGTVARAATQAAEDARLLTINKKQEAADTAQRQALQNRIQSAQSEADAAKDRAELARVEAQQEAERRTQAEAEREAAQRAAQEAEQARIAAEQQAQQAQQQAQQTQEQLQQTEAERQAALEQQQQLSQQAEQARQQAQQAQQQAQQTEAARQAALQQQQQMAQQAEEARRQAQEAEQARMQTEQQAQEQRARLLRQLNQVLQTKDTARGLVASMPDVLFAVNKASLRPAAKIRLAKAAGILLAYPDLKLEIDGFTDNTGSAEYNEKLSEQRAATVRDFLIQQGVPVNNVIARGMGQSDPIASNDTARGRQLNRRVEVVVSGTAIGENIAPGGATGTESGAAAAGSSGQAPANEGAPAPNPSVTGSDRLPQSSEAPTQPAQPQKTQPPKTTPH